MKSSRFFDIVPLNSKPLPPKNKPGDFFRFALTGFLVFAALSGGHLILKSKTWISQNQALALSGFEQIQGGVESLSRRDFKTAKNTFDQAEISFRQLSANTRFLTAQANTLLSENLYLEGAETLIGMGLKVAALGRDLVRWIDELQNLSREWTSLSPSALKRVSKEWSDFKERVASIGNHLQDIQGILLPAELRLKLAASAKKAAEIEHLMSEIDRTFQAGLEFLGTSSPHRILVLFQNKNERRATGGFIGSVALVTLHQGQIQKIEAKDVYEIDGQLLDEIAPPPGIAEVADRWYLRDANYSPDFPTSAEQILWFLEHSRGPSAESVIAIDQTVVEKMLEFTGPVLVKGFPFQLKAENVDRLLSFMIETQMGGPAAPKQLLFDLVPVLQKKGMSLADPLSVLPLARELTEGGHLQLYSKDPDIEWVARRWNLDGGIAAPQLKTDYLQIVSTSIGGNKSDRFIRMSADHKTEITRQGALRNRLTLTKRHAWTEQEFLKWKRPLSFYGTGRLSLKTLKFILGGGPNVDYLRVYVPQGSRLVGISGIEETPRVFSDLGYTVFAFPMEVAAGQTQSVTLEYDLPFALEIDPIDDYKLLVERQAGVDEMLFKKEWITAEGLQVAGEYPKNVSAFSLTPRYELSLGKSQTFLTAIQKTSPRFSSSR